MPENDTQDQQPTLPVGKTAQQSLRSAPLLIVQQVRERSLLPCQRAEASRSRPYFGQAELPSWSPPLYLDNHPCDNNQTGGVGGYCELKYQEVTDSAQ